MNNKKNDSEEASLLSPRGFLFLFLMRPILVVICTFPDE